MMKSPNAARSPPQRPPPPDPNVMKSRQQRHGGKSKITQSKSSATGASKLGDGTSYQHQGQHHHHHHHHHHHQQQQQQQVGYKSPGASTSDKLAPTRPAPPPPILTPGGSLYQSPVPAAEFGPSSMAKVLGPTAAAAHPHSTSSSSYRGEPLTRSVPTLGTITASPEELPPHVSPFPANSQQQQPTSPPSTATTATLTSGAPASSAASSTTAALTPTKGSTPTSSINTGTTPLTTTPGGTSQPIKLTMSGLAAAVASGNGTKSALATGGGGGAPSEAPQPTKSPADGRSQTVIVVAEGPKQTGAEWPGEPQAGAMIKAPILGLNQQQQREQLASKGPQSAGPIAAPTKSNFCNCAIYIFLGIFLLIIVALIIVLVLNRKQ